MVPVKFSIVAPIKDEVKILNRSLPSFYKVNPDEVLICTDDPSPKEVINAVKRIAQQYGMEKKTKVHPVPRNPEYSYHQAWVRRSGFLEAKNDVILTVDIDLGINRNILKAVQLVGKDNVGMVSLSKWRHPIDILSFLRAFGYTFLRLMYFFLLRHIRIGGLKMTLFTGLYAFYRPYWLETEDEGVKKMVPTAWKQDASKKASQDAYNVGEDNYLRDCMERKYYVSYLFKIGAMVIDRDKHSHSGIQFQRGRYNARQGRSLLGAITHTALHIEPNYFRGFLSERRRITGD